MFTKCCDHYCFNIVRKGNQLSLRKLSKNMSLWKWGGVLLVSTSCQKTDFFVVVIRTVRYKVRYLLIQYPFLCTFEQLKTLSRPHLNVLGPHHFIFFLYEEGSHRVYIEVKSSLSFPFWFVSLSLCFPARFNHKEELTTIQWNLGYLIDVHLSITIKLQ